MTGKTFKLFKRTIICIMVEDIASTTPPESKTNNDYFSEIVLLSFVIPIFKILVSVISVVCKKV